MVATCLNETSRPEDWEKKIQDLTFFVSIARRDLTFLITGPSTVERVDRLGGVLPSYVLTNGVAAHSALCHILFSEELGKQNGHDIPLDLILNTNVKNYERLVRKSSGFSKANPTELPMWKMDLWTENGEKPLVGTITS